MAIRSRIRLAILTALLAVGVAVVPAGSSAAPSCRNLKVDSAVRTALKKAHGRPRDGQIAGGSVYYGQCGSTKYAVATFSKALADQPERFRKLSGRRWVDKGDGFENGCSRSARGPIPKALVKIWGFCS